MQVFLIVVRGMACLVNFFHVVFVYLKINLGIMPLSIQYFRKGYFNDYILTNHEVGQNHSRFVFKTLFKKQVLCSSAALIQLRQSQLFLKRITSYSEGSFQKDFGVVL